MRERIFEIIEVAKEKNKISYVYDIVMMVNIFISIIPLAFKEEYPVFSIIDVVTVWVFIIDYILRYMTADYKLKIKKWSFLIYPFTPMAIIDLLSVLPSLAVVSSSLKIFKMFRMFRTLKIFRAFKFARYSKSVAIIINVFKRQKKILYTVSAVALGYIFISALLVFNLEPQSFNNIFDAVYWATVSLTTMGYGDIYPVTTVGRMVTMISSLFGIAVIALPSGIITAGFMEEIRNEKENAE